MSRGQQPQRNPGNETEKQPKTNNGTGTSSLIGVLAACLSSFLCCLLCDQPTLMAWAVSSVWNLYALVFSFPRAEATGPWPSMYLNWWGLATTLNTASFLLFSSFFFADVSFSSFGIGLALTFLVSISSLFKKVPTGPNLFVPLFVIPVLSVIAPLVGSYLATTLGSIVISVAAGVCYHVWVLKQDYLYWSD
jgi:hypothetical protein